MGLSRREGPEPEPEPLREKRGRQEAVPGTQKENAVSIGIGTKVRVGRDATYHVKAACKQAKKTYLMGVTKTRMDPCCGCYIVEFKRNIGTDSTFGDKGKLGYCEEVEEGFMTVVGKAAEPKATPKVDLKVGDFVEWVSDNYGPAKKGARGIILDIQGPAEVGVEFIVGYNVGKGHDLGGKSKDGAGWWVSAKSLKKVDGLGPIGVGTKVEVIVRHDSAQVGMKGVVVVIDEAKAVHPYGVRFPRWTGGHSLQGRLKGKQAVQGQWVPLASLKVEGVVAPEVEKPRLMSVAEPMKEVIIEKGFRVRILRAMKTATGSNPLPEGSTWSASRITNYYDEVYFIIPFGRGNTILAHGSDIEVL